MREAVSLTGMVVSAMPIGEYDKRLVILTKERGKIHAFARNARKQNSPLLACSQPFTFGEFSLYEGKTAYNLMGAQVQNYFLDLRQDLELVYYGFYFLELADYFSRENLDGTETLKLLYQSFRALISRREHLDRKLIRYIFEWKILAQEGMMPDLTECVGCGQNLDGDREKEKVFFSVRAGGCVCEKCRDRYTDSRPISSTVLYALYFIFVTPVEKLYTFTLVEEAKKELGELSRRYLKHYVDGSFKSLELL